jgi:5S rRNA maturation endonuclease (ribonuclease M5)
MPFDLTPEEAKSLLLVEGYSDQQFYAELMEQVGVYGETYIKMLNGRSDLAKQAKVFLKPSLLAGKRCVAVIVDADHNGAGIAERFSQLLGELTGQVVTCGGWTDGRPRVGLFVVPSVGETGEIETLVWKSWAYANGEQAACIEQYVACMKTKGVEPKSPEKGRVGALLALRNDDDPRLGPGARARVFDFDRPEYDDLKVFLRGFGEVY